MKSLAIIKNHYLTQAQKHLYVLICEKLKNDEKLLFEETRNIWLTYAHRDMRNGIPYFFNYWWRNSEDEMVGRNEPMNEEQINMSSSMWLTHNIGRLVLKGYLQVLPMIELKNIRIQS